MGNVDEPPHNDLFFACLAFLARHNSVNEWNVEAYGKRLKTHDWRWRFNLAGNRKRVRLEQILFEFIFKVLRQHPTFECCKSDKCLNCFSINNVKRQHKWLCWKKDNCQNWSVTIGMLLRPSVKSFGIASPSFPCYMKQLDFMIICMRSKSKLNQSRRSLDAGRRRRNGCLCKLAANCRHILVQVSEAPIQLAMRRQFLQSF